MKIIILGAGQVGLTFAEHFSKENNELTIVDNNASALTSIQEKLDVRTIVGHASYPNTLMSAGADTADAIIAVTSQDETNMVACQIAHTLFNVPMKVARVRSVQYSMHRDLFQDKSVPIDILISPESLVKNEIIETILHPDTEHIVSFANKKLLLVAVKGVSGGPLIQKPLKKLTEYTSNTNCKVVAIYRNNTCLHATPETMAYPGDDIYFITKTEQLDQSISLFHQVSPKPKRVVIAGGGNIGTGLTMSLENKMHIKVIESNIKIIESLAAQTNNAVVLHGNCTEPSLLKHENISETDVFAAVTNVDEINILSCMLAKSLGAKTTIAIITKDHYRNIVHSHIDVVVSPKKTTISSLLSYMRPGDVVQVHTLKFGEAEAIEAIVHGSKANSFAVGKCERMLELPPGAVLCAIVRKDEIILETANVIIEEGDHLIFFLEDRQYAPRLESFFSTYGTHV